MKLAINAQIIMNNMMLLVLRLLSNVLVLLIQIYKETFANVLMLTNKFLILVAIVQLVVIQTHVNVLLEQQKMMLANANAMLNLKFMTLIC